MKKYYLFYALLFSLLIAGCKKSSFDNTDTNQTSKTNPTGVTNPSVPALPQLLNFKINGATCAYDSLSSSYYYPVPLGVTLSNYTVTFDTTAAKAIYLDNVRLTSGATVNSTLRTNENVAIKAVNSLNTAVTCNLIITGLPIVILNANMTIADAQIKARFDMVNPDYQAQGSKLEIASDIVIAIRGATARYLPKKSYAVQMIDGGGSKTDISLLGLRSDDDWILDAMYIDQSRMRNRLCTDLWNSFNNVPYIASEPTAHNGTRGHMVEVFLNGVYHGLYCLTEKLDRKQLQVKKDYGDMYKSVDWGNEVQFLATSPYDNSSASWGGWQFAYPQLGDTPVPNWTYLYNEVNFFTTTTDEDFVNGIANKVDLNNMADYFIFENLINGLDNEAKNTYFSFYDYRSNMKFFYTPWDMDATFGRDYDGAKVSNSLVGTNKNYLFQRLIALNAGGFKDLVKARWAYLKNNQLTKSTVAAQIEAYRKVLVSSDAFLREDLLCGNIDQDLNNEASYMTNFYAGQFDLFDNYLNTL